MKKLEVVLGKITICGFFIGFLLAAIYFFYLAFVKANTDINSYQQVSTTLRDVTCVLNEGRGRDVIFLVDDGREYAHRLMGGDAKQCHKELEYIVPMVGKKIALRVNGYWVFEAVINGKEVFSFKETLNDTKQGLVYWGIVFTVALLVLVVLLGARRVIEKLGGRLD